MPLKPKWNLATLSFTFAHFFLILHTATEAKSRPGHLQFRHHKLNNIRSLLFYKMWLGTPSKLSIFKSKFGTETFRRKPI